MGILKNMFGLMLPQYLLVTTAAVISSSLYFLNLNLFYLILPWIVVSSTMFGLNVFNNFVDFKIDKILKPTRPTVNGTLKLKHVLFFSISLFSLAIFMSIFISGFVSLILTLVSVTLSIIYSLNPIRLKDRLFGANFVGGLLYGVFPYLLVSFSLSQPPNILFMFFLFSLVFCIAHIKDIEDAKFEKKLKVKNLVIFLGKKNALLATTIMLIILNLIMVYFALINVFKIMFIFASFISILLSTLVYYYLLGYKEDKVIVSQSKLVSYYMILIMIIELCYGVINIYNY
ncbi:MAG: UbiA family prenyltransferase [archaeon]